jgi:hypothetical protein
VLVYGDPKFEATLRRLHAALLAQARLAATQPNDADGLRALLIACGQVEQAAHDALEQAAQGPGAHDEMTRCLADLHQATAHAADACYSLTWQQAEPLPPPVVDAPTALARLTGCLAAMSDLPDFPVTVKLPEGFSFHALYPEQYAVAAGRWLADERTHGAPLTRAALVVGIRSIGTTLAAVVAAVLRAAGVRVSSYTVRPTGHPYDRQVDLLGQTAMHTGSAGNENGRPLRALVVDEGPGISGSSMAATAAALVAAGVNAEEIAFLPGHGGEPGGAGSEEVRAWWRRARRYVGEGEQLTFGGRPLVAALGDALAVRTGHGVVQMENISGGVWRQTAYPDAAQWPPVCNYFERVKYRATLTDGSRVLLKFLGLAAAGADLPSTAEAAAAELAARAARQLAPAEAEQAAAEVRRLAPEVLGTVLGFVATRWVEGTPLALPAPGQHITQRASLQDGDVALLGRYIARVAGPPLRVQELAAATARLTEMIYVNISEALGDEAAQRAADFTARYTAGRSAQHMGGDAQGPVAAYGDGRMLPYEFVRGVDGRLHKVDGVGHDCDHTLIGRQPLAWDLVGACVEWQLNPQATERLLAAFAGAGGPPIDAAAREFYRLAYLAFRTGQCTLAAEVHDPYERERLLGAANVYRALLAESLP